MAANNRFIQRLKIKNLLSFSDQGIDLELQPLNVLIGPNASGKSNLIETIGLLQSLPTDFAQGVRECGGIYDLLWKGAKETPVAEIETIISKALKAPALKEIFFSKGAEVRTELEVLDKYGATKRIDRLIISKDLIVAVDYKSTSESIEPGKKQMQEYIEILSEIYPGKRIEAKLVLLDTMASVKV